MSIRQVNQTKPAKAGTPAVGVPPSGGHPTIRRPSLRDLIHRKKQNPVIRTNQLGVERSLQANREFLGATERPLEEPQVLLELLPTSSS